MSVASSASGAAIQVFRDGVHVGTGSAPVVFLTGTLVAGDTVHAIPNLSGCSGRLALLGRSPIVVMAHRNHDPDDPSYLGYDYVQASLAKTGIITVSVECNALNGSGGGVGNIEARADLIIDSIKHFKGLDANAGNLFSDRIDFDRLALMGHSRGVDAVVTIPTVIGSIGVRTRAVLALAPTNFRYWAGMSLIGPAGYTFCTILPATNGDVVDNNGAQFYDQSVPPC